MPAADVLFFNVAAASTHAAPARNRVHVPGSGAAWVPVSVNENGIPAVLLPVLKEVLEPDDQIAMASPVNVTGPGLVASFSAKENTALVDMMLVMVAGVVPNEMGGAGEPESL